MLAAGLLSGLAAGAVDTLAKSLTKGAAQSKPALDGDKLKKTAQDFETMFLENVYDRVTANLGEGGLLGSNGAGSDIWRGMLTQQYAKATSQSGGVGLSDDIYAALLKLQSGHSQASDAATQNAGTAATQAVAAAAKS